MSKFVKNILETKMIFYFDTIRLNCVFITVDCVSVKT
jgi:hypothetical protein